MKRVWAPWRIEYIKQPKSDKCILCTIPRESKRRDRDNLLLYRGKKAYILMNRYPYNNGHMMVAPRRHIADIVDMTDVERKEFFELTIEIKKALSDILNPDGFNIGINCGRASGAGIEEHLHLHIVPRWMCDTNFMTTITDTRVIPQDFDSLYDKLKEFF